MPMKKWQFRVLFLNFIIVAKSTLQLCVQFLGLGSRNRKNVHSYNQGLVRAIDAYLLHFFGYLNLQT